MRNPFIRRIVCVSLAVTMMLSGASEVHFAKKAGMRSGSVVRAEEDVPFSIDKTYLVPDSQIVVNGADGYTLRYYVGDAEVDGETYRLSSDDYGKWIQVEAYSDSDTEPVATDRAYFSNLPVLYISTGGQAITSKETYLDGSLDIQNNTESDVMYSGAIKIRGRGNSSWNWPKKSYRLKLDKKADLFGMGSNKNWVLLANYLDECFLRNATGFQIAEELGLTTMSCEWTEVILNGEYVGNYLLCEQIRVDEGRVDIFDWEEQGKDIASAVYKAEKKAGVALDKDALEELLTTDLTWVSTGNFTFDGKTYVITDYYADANFDYSGGYLFELSDEADEISRFTSKYDLEVMIKSPEYLRTNDDMMDYVFEYWRVFEFAIRSEDGYVNTDDGQKHYSELADLDSMVAYWLVMEIMGNNDSVRKSRYAYKDIDGPITFGPVWDFDYGCGSPAVSSVAEEWKISKDRNRTAFYKEFLDDPLFLSRATEMYWEVRPFLESLIEQDGVLDREISYLSLSGEADANRWDRKVTWPSLARGFSGDAAAFKSYLTRRIAWLDQQFDTVDSLLASTKTRYSSHPYERSAKITATAPDASSDDISAHAPAEYKIESDQDLNLKVVVTDADTASLKVYVNGLEYTSVTVSGGEAQVVISASDLDAELGKKNVISFIGKRASGSTTYKNFTTVVQCEPVRKPTFETISMLLSGTLGVNYYLDLSALTEEERAASYMEFTVNGVTTTAAFDENFKNKAGQYYGFTCYISSVQMAESITAVYHYGQETISKTFSVQNYLNAVDANAGLFDETTIALVHAMGDYGHYIQPFVAANNHWVVGDRYAELALHYAEEYDYDAIREASSAYHAVVGEGNPDIDSFSFSLLPDMDTSIKVYIKPVAGYTGTLSVNGEKLSMQSDGRYCYVISGISAHRLGTMYTLNVVTSSGSTTMQVSGISYVYAVLTSDFYRNNQAAKDAVSSIYKYYEAAKAYREAHS